MLKQFYLNEIFTYLESIHPLSDELKGYLSEHTRLISFKKNEIILKEGAVARNIWFLLQGRVRCFHYEEDKEVTKWIIMQGKVVVAINSFATQSPSPDIISAMESCTIRALGHLQLQYAYQHFKEVSILSKRIMLDYYKDLDKRLSIIQIPSLALRYETLLREFPELFNTIPLPYIASFVNMSLRSLMRIRNSERIKRKRK